MSAQVHPGLGRRVLIDSNVWIEAFDPAADPARYQRIHDLIVAQQAATCEVVIAEVLRGAPDDATAARMEARMRVLECLPCDGMGAMAARMGRRLHASRGLFADMLIAAVAFENGAGLLTRDAQLAKIAAAFGIPVE